MRALQHGEGTLIGPRGSRIYYQYWLPDGDPKAVLLLVHGLGEHSGRYGNVVNHFVPRGYGIYALDHYGHGKSEGQREYVERFGDYTQPLKIFFEMVQGWQPGQRIFLVGHSLGGLISADYLLEHQAGLSGAVLSGPAVKLPSLSPALLVMGSEGPGLSEPVVKACTKLVKIPMAGRLDSLNLAVATALMLYQIRGPELKL